MDTWIHWTDANEAHIARHGVIPQEVEQAAESPYRTFPGREGSTILLGRTYAGRHPTVVLADAIDDHRSWYVVTDRDMTPKERRTFQRRV
ncbi:BrnT family toxin [Nocardiopsis halotolerans]|uniref:hypothetical protein n=1 Tax=Nocardiopsis halotolerans TaxID=124252 RepID=UPI00035DF010|nr:hypothetical protein [Nocardiopsis halotolerans]